MAEAQQVSQTAELVAIIIGKTGSGKSSLGNALLNKPSAFKVVSGMASGTIQCAVDSGVYDNRPIRVVDTPGTMDTSNPEQALQEIGRAVGYCPEGVDVFLPVIKFNDRFTEDKALEIENALGVFGPQADARAVAVFSHVSNATNFDKCLADYRTKIPRLDSLLNRLGNRYHAMDNSPDCQDEKRKEQLEKLVKLCDEVRKQCLGRYNVRMFDSARMQEQQSQPQQRKLQLQRKHENVILDGLQMLCNFVVQLAPYVISLSVAYLNYRAKIDSATIKTSDRSQTAEVAKNTEGPAAGKYELRLIQVAPDPDKAGSSVPAVGKTPDRSQTAEVANNTVGPAAGRLIQVAPDPDKAGSLIAAVDSSSSASADCPASEKLQN